MYSVVNLLSYLFFVSLSRHLSTSSWFHPTTNSPAGAPKLDDSVKAMEINA
jgi:hypothetical protein